MCKHLHGCNCHIQGVPGRFGDRTAPLDQGFWRRFKRMGQVEDNTLFQPISGLPFIQLGAFRIASPTGKGGRVERGRLIPQGIEDTPETRPLVFAFAQPSNANNPNVTQSVIDPWSTIKGKPTSYDFDKGGGKLAG